MISSKRLPVDKAILLQNGLISRAYRRCEFDGGNPPYKELRSFFGDRPDTRTKLPDFLRRCSDLGQFWGWIKYEKPTYQERRDLIWDAFRPLIEFLEADVSNPAVAPITEALGILDADHVKAAWQKALDRRANDPEGAITAARTLLDTVCKHVLEDAHIAIPEGTDLPKLWALSAEHLNLAPHQHQENLFKAILGNCQSVVNHLGAIRKRIGDAHGQGRRPVRPKPRHADWRSSGRNNGRFSRCDVAGPTPSRK